MRILTTILLAVPLLASAQVALSPDRLAQRYPYGSIQSVEMADQANAEVEQTRNAIESTFVAEEKLCMPTFFTTSCLEEAKERRRTALARIRSIEVEANTFRRRARAVERDNVLAEQRLQDEMDEKRRMEEAASKPAEERRGPTDGEIIAEQKKRADNVLAYEKKQRDAVEKEKQRQAKRAAAEKAAAERAANATP